MAYPNAVCRYTSHEHKLRFSKRNQGATGWRAEYFQLVLYRALSFAVFITGHVKRAKTPLVAEYRIELRHVGAWISRLDRQNPTRQERRTPIANAQTELKQDPALPFCGSRRTSSREDDAGTQNCNLWSFLRELVDNISTWNRPLADVAVQ